MNEKEIAEILEKHAKWLNNEPGGKKAVLRGSDLHGCNLRYSNLSNSDLHGCDLSHRDLSNSILSHSDLSYSDLINSDLSHSDLSNSNLHGCNLINSDLSGAKGIATAKDYLSQFEKDRKGIIVYKAIGNTYQPLPTYWDIKPLSFLEEVVNPSRTVDCGSGVNFATLDWIKKNFEEDEISIWKCRILWEDLADVVVPYNTDGKARCARLQLIEPLKEEL
jgi:uncharacterized protein YjbI with pentapeptide repeats